MLGCYKLNDKTKTTEFVPSAGVEIKSYGKNMFSALFEKEKLKEFGKKAYLLWRLISLGKCRLYYAIADGLIVGHFLVVYRCFKFKYLKADEYEIGPCAVDERFRGRGIYPTAVDYIIKDNAGRRYNIPTLIIKDDNMPSIRGVKKLGFEKISALKKSRIMKIYKYEKEVDVKRQF